MALLRWYGSPGFFDSGSSAFFGLVSHFPLDNTAYILWGSGPYMGFNMTIDYLWGSGLVSLLASQAHNTMVALI